MPSSILTRHTLWQSRQQGKNKNFSPLASAMTNNPSAWCAKHLESPTPQSPSQCPECRLPCRDTKGSRERKRPTLGCFSNNSTRELLALHPALFFPAIPKNVPAPLQVQELVIQHQRAGSSAARKAPRWPTWQTHDPPPSPTTSARQARHKKHNQEKRTVDNTGEVCLLLLRLRIPYLPK